MSLMRYAMRDLRMQNMILLMNIKVRYYDHSRWGKVWLMTPDNDRGFRWQRPTNYGRAYSNPVALEV